MTRLIAKRQGMDLIIHLDHEPSLDHLETVNGQTNQVWVDLTFADPRKARPRQRRLFFALLNDISEHFIRMRSIINMNAVVIECVRFVGKRMQIFTTGTLWVLKQEYWLIIANTDLWLYVASIMRNSIKSVNKLSLINTTSNLLSSMR